VLLLVLPFEPRLPAFAALGFDTTLLEVIAAAVMASLSWLARERLPTLVRRPPLPLLLLAAFAAAHLVSAVLAEVNRGAALKFALRMCVMTAFAALVAALSAAVLARALVALAIAGSAVAALALLEGLGLRSIDPLLGMFREVPFNVGGVRRASAGSEYPNLAAAFIMYGLLAGVGMAARLARPAASILPWSALLCGGLLYTYSRGALVATGAGIAALGAALVLRDGRAAFGSGAARACAVALAVLGGSAALSAAEGDVFRLRLESEGIERWYDAAYAPAEASFALDPGESRRTSVRITNRGLRPWTAREAFHLSYHWYDARGRLLGDGGRTALPQDVGPGASVVLDPEIEAPRREGGYLLGWDMVHEHTTWFSAQGVPVASVPAIVSRARKSSSLPQAAPLVTPAGWRPGRGELWAIAASLWREHPFFGVGSDNYRWLYGPHSHHLAWDSRVFANHTLLEAAATTGSAGALALAGTLGAVAVGAWRALAAAARGSHEAAVAGALLALVAGLTVHGLVDYVLAFTGHYLLFGFVVGGVSSLWRRNVGGATRLEQ
jgi:hypothetical protein